MIWKMRRTPAAFMGRRRADLACSLVPRSAANLEMVGGGGGREGAGRPGIVNGIGAGGVRFGGARAGPELVSGIMRGDGGGPVITTAGHRGDGREGKDGRWGKGAQVNLRGVDQGGRRRRRGQVCESKKILQRRWR